MEAVQESGSANGAIEMRVKLHLGHGPAQRQVARNKALHCCLQERIQENSDDLFPSSYTLLANIKNKENSQYAPVTTHGELKPNSHKIGTAIGSVRRRGMQMVQRAVQEQRVECSAECNVGAPAAQAHTSSNLHQLTRTNE
jgi:hypothetical protein